MKAWAQLWGLWPMAPGLSHKNLWLKKYIASGAEARPKIDAQSDVWALLKQHSLPRIREFGSAAHWSGLQKMGVLESVGSPTLEEVAFTLTKESDWTIVECQGELRPEEFFMLLSRKKFPMIRKVRPADEVFCGSKPDLWHELVGHISLLCSPEYSRFYQSLAKLFCKVQLTGNAEELNRLQQLLWVLLEYGFVAENGTPKCFGAALVGSVMGIERLRRGVIAIERFDLKKVIDSKIYFKGPTLPRNKDGQLRLFAVESLDEILEALKLEFSDLAS